MQKATLGIGFPFNTIWRIALRMSLVDPTTGGPRLKEILFEDVLRSLSHQTRPMPSWVEV